MNQDTLVVVHCYAGDVDRVHKLLPFWLHHNCPVLVLSPEDAPVYVGHPRIGNHSVGKAGWKGSHTVKRQIEHWKIIYEHREDYFFLNDSDSFCVTPELPEYLYDGTTDVWANIVGWPSEDNPMYGMNFEPPYFMTRNALGKLIDLAENLPPKYRNYLEDDDVEISGFYMTLCQYMGLKSKRFPDGLRAYPSIDYWYPWTLDLTENEGKRIFHGCKSRETADRLENRYKRWVNRTLISERMGAVEDTIREVYQ